MGWAMWFIVAYITIYCFSNYIVKFLDGLENKELKILLLIYGILNTVLGFLMESDTYGGSYTVVAMLFVYLLGYSIKRFNFSFKLKNKSINIFVYLGCAILIGVLGGLLIYFNQKPLARKMMISNQSPLLIVSGCALFMCFVNDIKLKPSKAISKIATHVLACYLLTDSVDVHDFVWLPLTNAAAGGMSWYLLLLCLIGYVIGIMIACILIDILRKLIYSCIEKFILNQIKKRRKVNNSGT